MQHEAFLGLGMGVPEYHDHDHLEEYNTKEMQSAEGGVSVLIEIIDDIIHAPENAPNTSQEDLGGGQAVRHMFRQEYQMQDDEYSGELGDTIRFSVNHVRYLGKGALRQEYSLLIETLVEHKNTQLHTLATKYFIEETNDPLFPYYATILRPDILTAGNMDDDMMTPYDCDEMFDTLELIEHLDEKVRQKAQDNQHSV